MALERKGERESEKKRSFDEIKAVDFKVNEKKPFIATF